MLRRLCVLALSLVALAGCTDGRMGSAAVSGTDAAAGGTSSTASAAAAADGVPARVQEEVPDDAPAAKPELILEPGGLGVAVDDTRVEHLPFGTAAGTVRTAVARLLGPLTTRRRTDCPQGPRTSSTTGGFELLFRGDRFVGWTDAGAPGRHLTTGDGIGVGVTVDALEHSGTDVTVQRAAGGSTAQWSSGPAGLAGRASSVSPHGRVTLVSSGETCVAG